MKLQTDLWFTKFISKLTFIDMKLIGIYGMLLGVILVYIIPSMVSISVLWYVIPAILCAIWLCYVLFFRK